MTRSITAFAAVPALALLFLLLTDSTFHYAAVDHLRNVIVFLERATIWFDRWDGDDRRTGELDIEMLSRPKETDA